MSVINDMLRDLDARKAPEREQPAQVAVADIIEPQSPPSQLLKWVLLFVLLLLMMSITTFGLLKSMDGERQVETKATGVAAETKDASGAADAPAAADDTPREANMVPTEMPADELVTSTANATKRNSAEAMPDGVALSPDSKRSDDASTEASPTIQAKAPVTKVAEAEGGADAALAVGKRETVVASQLAVAKPVTRPAPKEASKQNAEKGVTLSPGEQDHAVARDARKLFSQDQTAAAYRMLYDFLARAQQDEQSRAVLAGQLMQEGRYAEAGDLLLDNSVSNSPDLRQIKARWYMQQGEADLALYTLREIQPELTDYPDYYALLASYYQQLGYPQQAAQVYTRLLDYDYEMADWWAGLAIAHDQSRRFDDARVAYERAIQLPGLNRQLADFVQQRLATLVPGLSERSNE